MVDNIRVLIVHWSLTALSMATVEHFVTIWIHPWMRFSWRGRFWMNYWRDAEASFSYLVELVNFSSDLSFWLSSLWPSAFSASYFSCDFFFFTMRIVRRSRRVKAATAPMTIGRRRSISAPKASCLCKKWPHNYFGSATKTQHFETFWRNQSTHRRVWGDPGTPSVKLLIKDPTLNLCLLIPHLVRESLQRNTLKVFREKKLPIWICWYWMQLSHVLLPIATKWFMDILVSVIQKRW